MPLSPSLRKTQRSHLRDQLAGDIFPLTFPDEIFNEEVYAFHGDSSFFWVGGKRDEKTVAVNDEKGITGGGGENGGFRVGRGDHVAKPFFVFSSAWQVAPIMATWPALAITPDMHVRFEYSPEIRTVTCRTFEAHVVLFSQASFNATASESA